MNEEPEQENLNDLPADGEAVPESEPEEVFDEGEPSKVAPDSETEEGAGTTRRKFVGSAALTSVVGGLLLQSGLSLKSFIPSVLYEPPQAFKVGEPSAIPEGVTFFPDQRVFLVREEDQFHAISAVCTHLGCTVNSVELADPEDYDSARDADREPDQEGDWQFHCPCHGSKYYADGTNFTGPAPRPLDWFRLEIAPDDGQLVVDKSSRVEMGWKLKV